MIPKVKYLPVASVEITFSAPLGYVRLLQDPKFSGRIEIPWAKKNLNSTEKAVKNWQCGLRVCGFDCKSSASLLAEAQSDPDQMEVTAVFTRIEWISIEYGASLLGMSAADYVLACAGYDAALVEQERKEASCR